MLKITVKRAEEEFPALYTSKMATKQLIGTISFPNNSQNCELQTEDKCSNCVKMEEKLASALIDLKTAETIISILSADLKLNSEL